MLAEVRRTPGVTRAEIARRLRLSSGLATELCARLRELRLLTEEPAPARGRGRPTTVLRAHPEGPLVAVLELRQEDWRSAVASLDGAVRLVETVRHGPGHGPADVLAAMRSGLDRVRRGRERRVRAVSLSVPAPVRGGRLVENSTLRWRAVDFADLAAGTGAPLLVGNDAILAGVAETRTGAAVGAAVAVHLILEAGIGGALILDGRPMEGAHGTAGEFGHMPFGDRSLRCLCGARGCWDVVVDGNALARSLGDPTPSDVRTYTETVLARAASGDVRAGRAVRDAAVALASGLAGLANAHDPDVITLGGLAAPLRAAARDAFDAAYLDGLMSFHRAAPPPVLDAAHADDGSLHGAAAVGLDHITTESALATWSDLHP
ncbi:ROK family transcriptional regulator [Bailinhaonella thermotolerans]|uniref:ROK family transcriptional regulator n=1 Tax=Bailinhaonella thermotolerans TaxID=1070861 RepID=A0A3A4B2M5_9ACTN|nr:ROK family transcriptional regulator [Bailinhaonella thermotolerans]